MATVKTEPKLLGKVTLQPVTGHEASSDNRGVGHHDQPAECEEHHNDGVFVTEKRSILNTEFRIIFFNFINISSRLFSFPSTINIFNGRSMGRIDYLIK